MSDEQLWFGGLPMTGSRPLSAEELAEAKERINAIVEDTIRGYGLLLLSVALSGAVIALTLNVPIGAIIALAVAKILPTTLPSLNITSPNRIRALRRDTRRGIVNVCRIEEWVVEVLPDSDLVWREHGVAPAKPTYYRKAATAPAPERAAAAANFVQPVDETVFAHQRPLTHEERQELSGYHPRPPLPMFLLPIISAFGAIATFVRAWTTHDFFTSFAFVVITVWTGRALYRDVRGWRRLAPDIALGTVIIVRVSEDGELGVAEEYLPHSQLLWTSEGVPALWRRIRG